MQLVLVMGDTFVALWPPLAERVKLRQAKQLVIQPKTRLPITPASLVCFLCKSLVCFLCKHNAIKIGLN